VLEQVGLVARIHPQGPDHPVARAVEVHGQAGVPWFVHMAEAAHNLFCNHRHTRIAEAGEHVNTPEEGHNPGDTLRNRREGLGRVVHDEMVAVRGSHDPLHMLVVGTRMDPAHAEAAGNNHRIAEEGRAMRWHKEQELTAAVLTEADHAPETVGTYPSLLHLPARQTIELWLLRQH
jgi:hypothetical protein